MEKGMEAQVKPRNRKAEVKRAKAKLAGRVSDLAAARHDGSLGDDHIKLAQVLIMCSLPHSQTDKQQIVRKARLGDGTYLTVTFTSMLNGVPLPFGRDRKLLAWIFDRAIRSDSPFVGWSAANEYQREMGLPEGGRSNKQLQERFQRIAGLGIAIERERDGITETTGYKVLAQSRLPKSISGRTIDANQRALPGMEEGLGIRLTAELFTDIRRHNYALPRLLWQTLTGPSQVQDIALWLFVRCYAAASETVIPWAALQDQFGAEDSNPWRIKARAREAIKVLGTLWPETSIEEEAEGIRVRKADAPLLADDPQKKRVRRLN